MAEKACHVIASTAQVGLIQALGPMGEITYQLAKEPTPFGEFIGIDLAPDDPQRPFCVWSGVGYHTHAKKVSASELLDSWPEHLALADTWLEPLLRSNAHSGSTLAASVLTAYESYHGKQAPAVDSAGA